jgi:excisionase family DNA binding protein
MPLPPSAPTQEGRPDDLLTIPEAAELLKVSAVTISRWRRQGKLRAFKVGPRAVRIRRGDLLDVFAPDRDSDAIQFVSIAAPDEPAIAADSPTGQGADALAVDPATFTFAQRTLQSDVIAQAATLRTAILTRRGGIQLPSALDDGSRVRDKRRKRK